MTKTTASVLVLGLCLGLVAARATARDGSSIHLVGATFDPIVEGVVGARNGDRLVIVQLDGPVRREHRAALEGAGLEVHHYLPENAFAVVLPPDVEIDRARDLPHVRWIGPYLAEYKVDARLLEPPELGGEKRPIHLDLHLIPGSDAVGVARTVRHASAVPLRVVGIFVRPHRTLLRVESVAADRARVARAAADQWQVVSVAERLPPHLLNDDSVWVVQSYDHVNGPGEANLAVPRQYELSATVWQHGLLGQDQIVAVADSGLSTMCFFEYDANGFPTPQSPVPPDTGTIDPARKVMAYWVEPGAEAQDHSACSYHGTHVAGSVAGDNRANLADPVAGLANQNAGDGMAPAAQLVMQDVGAASGFDCSLSGLSGDLTSMFEQAYAAGARIHTNSWGSDQPIYSSDAQDMDEMMWRREDIVFTVAMGNSGTAQGDSSIGSPATAKNIISVGGVSNGGSSSRADAMTTYSRGPTEDGRLKPDVVTPAYSIVSADGGSTCSTTSKSGTSMATPTTAGAVALLREYFGRGFAADGAAEIKELLNPSGALMKAALTCGATPLGLISGNDPLGGTVTPIPSMDQGWGRTFLEGALYFAGDDERVRYWDVRHRNGIETDDSWQVTVDVPAGTSELRTTLAWSDPPSATSAAVNLVNDLDLELTSPDRTVYLGNVFNNGWSVTGGEADTLNPIETVRLADPPAGTWTIRVVGTNVPGTGIAINSHRQGFALVSRCGECTGPVPAVPTGLVATDNGESGVLLSWDEVVGATQYTVLVADGGCSEDPADFTVLATSSTTELVDSRTQGGFTTGYRVVADGGCNQSDRSSCVSATATGPCSLVPSFAGLTSINNSSTLAQCSLTLDWTSGVSSCPLGAPLTYHIYRSSDPLFVPGPDSWLAATNDVEYVDRSVLSGETFYYVVRAEDATNDGNGPNGGNQEENLVRLKGTSWVGTSGTVGEFSDDGGDTVSWLELEHPWTVSDLENHTDGGSYAYRSAVSGENYPAGTCAAITTPPLELAAGLGHELHFWARYNIEVDWDGVVVEVSADGGQSWSDTPPTVGYPGDFSQTGDPPINACGFASNHGAFNGPGGNSELTPWSEYIVDLDPFDGETVLIRWRLSTDPGFEAEGFYLDDITVSNVRGPGACANPNGSIRLDRTSYACDDVITVEVLDADLIGAGYQQINLTAAGERSLDVMLAEDPAGSGRLIASVATSPTPSPAALQVADADEIIATYVDASDGLGGIDVVKTDTAVADCSGPQLTDISVSNVGAVEATVFWSTDEAATSAVRLEPGSLQVEASALVTSHSLLVSGLSSCTQYTVFASSADSVGNQSEEPGPSFMTLDGHDAINDDIESGQGAWILDPADIPEDGNSWAIELDPQGQGADHAWWSRDDDSDKDDRLVAGPLLIGTGETVLTFEHHFNFEPGWDGGVLEVAIGSEQPADEDWIDITELTVGEEFLSGGYTGTVRSYSGTDLADRAAWTTEDGVPRLVEVDLSSLAGQTAWIRFRLVCDGSVGRDGWLDRRRPTGHNRSVCDHWRR